MTKPVKPAEERRDTLLEVAVTKAEKAELVAAAKGEGLPTGAFIRNAALQKAKTLAGF